MAKDSDNPLSIFLPRLDEAEGPALPLSRSEHQERVRAALMACGVNASKSLGQSVAPELPGAARPSGSYLVANTPTSNAAKPARPSLTPWGKRRLKAATIIAVIASSSAAAALSANWSDIASWLETRDGAAAMAPNPPALTARLSSVANNLPKPAPIQTDAPDVEEPAALEATQPPKRAPASTVYSRSPVSPGEETTKPSAAPQAEDLLGAANALRAERRYPEALAKYLQVAREHPGSPQAAAARVSAATLRLEHGNDADGALELLEGATSARDAIPEAEFLIAESYRAQGKTRQEQQALRQFLSRSPDHPLASKARRRLETLKRDSSEKLR